MNQIPDDDEQRSNINVHMDKPQTSKSCHQVLVIEGHYTLLHVISSLSVFTLICDQGKCWLLQILTCVVCLFLRRDFRVSRTSVCSQCPTVLHCRLCEASKLQWNMQEQEII